VEHTITFFSAATVLPIAARVAASPSTTKSVNQPVKKTKSAGGDGLTLGVQGVGFGSSVKRNLVPKPRLKPKVLEQKSVSTVPNVSTVLEFLPSPARAQPGTNTASSRYAEEEDELNLAPPMPPAQERVPFHKPMVSVAVENTMPPLPLPEPMEINAAMAPPDLGESHYPENKPDLTRFGSMDDSIDDEDASYDELALDDGNTEEEILEENAELADPCVPPEDQSSEEATARLAGLELSLHQATQVLSEAEQQFLNEFPDGNLNDLVDSDEDD
jgi:hypothetical protein